MSEVDKLKAQARRARLDFDAMLDGVDCGAAMLKTIKPEAQAAADRYNAAMAGLEKIDPNFPKGKPWLPL
jgi:hypothetical protein